MDGKFTITLTLKKKDHSLQIHSDDSPGLMWSIAAIRQAIGTGSSTSISNINSQIIYIMLTCDLETHNTWWSGSEIGLSEDWSDAIFQQALEHLNNEQRFVFALLKQKEMAEASRFQGMITDMRRQ